MASAKKAATALPAPPGPSINIFLPETSPYLDLKEEIKLKRIKF